MVLRANCATGVKVAVLTLESYITVAGTRLLLESRNSKVDESILAVSIASLKVTVIDTTVETLSDSLVIEEAEVEDVILDEEDSIDLDDIDSIDDIDALDSFGDIEDLDSIDELDEFDDTKDIEEELAESEDSEEFPIEESGELNEDYQRFSLIQSAMNHFYTDNKYESEFIENVYIADCVGISSDLKRYLEEEMFLSVYVRHVELTAEVSDLALKEFGL